MKTTLAFYQYEKLFWYTGQALHKEKHDTITSKIVLIFCFSVIFYRCINVKC